MKFEFGTCNGAGFRFDPMNHINEFNLIKIYLNLGSYETFKQVHLNGYPQLK